MILELVWPYIPVVVVSLFWAVAMRPVLRLIHLAPNAAPGRAPRSPGARRRRPARG
jgi:hypothetical protein